MTSRMHHDEIDSDVDLVRRLLREQHPQWADRPIERVTSTGTANALFRVGPDLVARLPLRPSETRPAEKERRWLSVLAPHLPLAVPTPVAVGEPSDAFPWPWGVYPWFPGDDAISAPIDLSQAAIDLAVFVRALQAIDPTDGPGPSAANYGRGVPLATRDDYTRRAIEVSDGLVDAGSVLAAWEADLAAPPWEQPPVWVHGDLAAGNLLVDGGRLRAVIDWGALGVGDPACDLVVAWELFDAASREVLRAELAVDDATWARGRGWALSTAVVALPYYVTTNPFMADQARRKLAAVLDDLG